MNISSFAPRNGVGNVGGGGGSYGVTSSSDRYSTSMRHGGAGGSSSDEAYDDNESIFADENDDSQTSSQHHRLGDANGINGSTDNKSSEFITADSETQQIWCLQLFVSLVLVLATGLTAFVIFFQLSTEEREQFRNIFEGHAAKVIDGFQEQFLQTVDAMDHFGVSYTSYGRVEETPWPFISLPDYVIRGPSMKSLTHTEMVAFLPLVSNSNRQRWDAISTVDGAPWAENIGAGGGGGGTSTVVSRSAPNDNDHSDSGNIFDGSRNNNFRYLAKEEIIVDKADTSPSPVPDSSGFGGENRQPSPSPPVGSSTPDDPIIRTNQENGSENIQKPDTGPSAPTPDGSDDVRPVIPPTRAPITSLPLPVEGEPVKFNNGIATSVYRIEHESKRLRVEDYGHEYYLPLWQGTPAVPSLVNYNLLSHDLFRPEIEETMRTEKIVIGKSFGMDVTIGLQYLYQTAGQVGYIYGKPGSQVYLPVYDDLHENKRMVGIILAVISWDDYLAGILPASSIEPIVCVLENSHGQQFTYQIVGRGATFLGEGDQHHRELDDWGQSFEFSDTMKDVQTFSRASIDAEFCPYKITIYPTQEMQDQFITNKPMLYTIAVVLTFLSTVMVIGLLSYLTHRRHKVLLETAAQSSAVVSSLFPAVVRDRLFAGKAADKPEQFKQTSAKRRLKTFLDEGKRRDDLATKPIADLFPYATVMFADISGFTAWSSVREPSQVFTLLETIYRAFDHIAKKRRVFKVETIGDCYVAVTGLPDPQDDHAVIMAKFALECMIKMNDLVGKLETSLGPDTGDLKMRFGLHSGPVTAGVLRGEKSRFQLFGDTVNTAARMESTGKPDHVQCSQATADLLIQAGKSHWICPRDEIVRAKGKGEVQTFWIDPKMKNPDPSCESSIFDMSKRSFTNHARDFLKGDKSVSHRSLVWGDAKNFVELPANGEVHKHQRLIDWNVDLLKGLLKQILARRLRRKKVPSSQMDYSTLMSNSNPRSQVTEMIVMPSFNPKAAKKEMNSSNIELSHNAMTQLKSYVTTIAYMYHEENPFHNFEHASHVTMSANKLLKRVVTPDDVYDKKGSKKQMASNLHEYTYGITSDPLTQFAIIFSALIHDVDHCGVSNGQLVKERAHTAIKYGGKSVAEQNSVDLAWDLLMEPDYEDLQKCIYSNEIEFRRFRNLVTNSVIATDIFDKELKDLRNRRWDKAFHQSMEDRNLKATIVIEHIIQAADVSHTMQHWHIYQKWNERLFREMYSAYRSGRGGNKDPSEGWYKGELWFYDNYVIPLAKKLNECGVFGVASAECLTYALDNRREWEAKGEDIVRQMKQEYSTPKWAQSPVGSERSGYR